ncbi:MAG: cytochrome c [Hyphomonadaceae bacterium]
MYARAIATLMITAVLAASACATTFSPQSESEEQGWAGTSATPDAGQVADGRRIADAQCAVCHAVDARSRSPNPAAPPLRDVLAIYDPDNLAYRFIDALQVGHDEMPRFDFDVRAADALIAYLKSISGK